MPAYIRVTAAYTWVRVCLQLGEVGLQLDDDGPQTPILIGKSTL
ncbi:MAG: hypothetical protein U0176_04980 [Bacteroidia bacterium]